MPRAIPLDKLGVRPKAMADRGGIPVPQAIPAEVLREAERREREGSGGIPIPQAVPPEVVREIEGRKLLEILKLLDKGTASPAGDAGKKGSPSGDAYRPPATPGSGKGASETRGETYKPPAIEGPGSGEDRSRGGASRQPSLPKSGPAPKADSVEKAGPGSRSGRLDGGDAGATRALMAEEQSQAEKKRVRQLSDLHDKSDRLKKYLREIEQRGSEHGRREASRDKARESLVRSRVRIDEAESLLGSMREELAELNNQDSPSLNSPAYSRWLVRITELRAGIRDTSLDYDRVSAAYRKSEEDFGKQDAAVKAEAHAIAELKEKYKRQIEAYDREAKAYRAAYQEDLNRRVPSGDHAR